MAPELPTAMFLNIWRVQENTNTQIENKDREAEVTGQWGWGRKKVQRKQRKRTGRRQEGEAIKVKRKEQRLGRGTLKKRGKKKVGRLEREKPSDTRYSLSPWIRPRCQIYLAFMGLVTNKLCQLNNSNLIHECLQCALLYSL